jgi:uncharacterized membrane protein YadS
VFVLAILAMGLITNISAVCQASSKLILLAILLFIWLLFDRACY